MLSLGLFLRKLTFSEAKLLLLSLLKINANKTIFTRYLMVSPIKLIQVVSTSEFHVDFIFFSLHLMQGLRSLKH